MTKILKFFFIVLSILLILYLSLSCGNSVSSPENNIDACRDQKDNDKDGLVDCSDPDCYFLMFCQDGGPDVEDDTDIVDTTKDDTDIVDTTKDDTDIVDTDVTDDIDIGCIPNCINKECGDDGCGGSCGSCGNNAVCNREYQCQCNEGYANCDNNWVNGCEVNVLSEPNNCGGCGNNCGENATCVNGNCQCNSGYGNCDGNWLNGCEVDLTTDDNNCGSCGNRCGGSGSTDSVCNNGQCSCVNVLYQNCDGDWSNGCEAYLRGDDNNCGRCGARCPANSHCRDATCYCITGYRNCELGTLSDRTSPSDNDGCECYTGGGEYVCDINRRECCRPNIGDPCISSSQCCSASGGRCVNGRCQ